MKEPRPSTTSARPEDRASTVAKRWYRRTGSSEESTETAVPRRMVSVAVASPARTVSGAEIAKSLR